MSDSKSSLLDGPNDTNFRSLGLLWAEQLTFKVIKAIQEVSAGFWKQKALGELFSNLYKTIAQLSMSLES
jgi:hypothetical protein